MQIQVGLELAELRPIQPPKFRIFIGLPRKQKISVQKKGFKKVKLERNADDFGLFVGAETLEKQGRKISG